MAKQSISENSLTILNFLIENEGKHVTASDIADATGLTVAGVNGSVTAGLIGTREPKRNFAVREALPVTDGEGNIKTINFIKVTEAGKAYDHEAAVAADEAEAARIAEEKAAAKAAKEAAKADAE